MIYNLKLYKFVLKITNITVQQKSESNQNVITPNLEILSFLNNFNKYFQVQRNYYVIKINTRNDLRSYSATLDSKYFPLRVNNVKVMNKMHF